MSFWVVRAGKRGETEAYALEQNVVQIGWDEVGDLTNVKEREALQRLVTRAYPNESIGTTRVWTGELWAMRERIQVDDLVAIPLKSRAAIAIGKVIGPYRYLADASLGGKHQRPVKWIRTDLPRVDFDRDLLFSLGSTLAVFQVKRNNAEERILSMIEGQPKSASTSGQLAPAVEEEEAPADLEQAADDQIVSYIGRKFRGHELSRLVAGLLTAQGYKVRISPAGADGGVDIIAGTGPMGFDRPRLAVQVKSSDSPADVSILRELQGVMPRFGAEQGLLVAWGGFKDSVIREARELYFEVRLWDAGSLVAAIQETYEKLPTDLQAELPLKRIWTIVAE